MVESNSFQSFICLVHAFLGCDTTSRIFSIGKNKVLIKDPDLCRTFAKEAEIFYINETKESVASSGERLMISLFKKSFKGSINELRAKSFMTKVKSQTVVKPSSPPPYS